MKKDVGPGSAVAALREAAGVARQYLLCAGIGDDIEALIPKYSGVPSDVGRLVVASRRVAFEDISPEALRELDQASEAFASRVPWENEPRDSERIAQTPPPTPEDQ